MKKMKFFAAETPSVSFADSSLTRYRGSSLIREPNSLLPRGRWILRSKRRKELERIFHICQ